MLLVVKEVTMSMRCRIYHAMLLGIAICLSSGCRDPLRPDYGSLGLLSVTGEVKLDGEPLPETVLFFEATDGTMSYAKTDVDGRYRMKFNSEVDGVLPGKKLVRISTTAHTGEIARSGELDSESPEEDDPDARPRKSKPELVPIQYNRKSKLVVDIAESATLNFDLNSDGSTKGPTNP